MAVTDEILTEVKQIHGKVSELLEWKAMLDERCKNRARMLNGVRDTVYGDKNPGTGLVGQVQRLTDCKKNPNRTNWRAFWLAVLRQVVTVGILGLIAWLLFIYRSLPPG